MKETFEKDGSGFTVFMGLDAAPSYLVTYGFFATYGLPEIIVFGDKFMLDTLLRLYNEMIDALENLISFRDDQHWPMKCDGHHVVGRFVEASNVTADRFGDAQFCHQLAGISKPIPAYQLFWPDENGRFPWERGCSEVCRSLQPLLSNRLYEVPTRRHSLRSRLEAIIETFRVRGPRR
ncbi:hypothetical protein C7I55_16165 [Sphingomonas deserti]|uniref:DUF4262 domain-containing protein n=1 Tax=Allosphingosinicella deserti TaxID=2116704 RepID=A0A2P7QLL9_9SPHN|nr:hypothetical protein C7I55_16165 [Sphingomonas deserti]